MTLETKKLIALIGSAMAVMVAVAGNILMAIQIKTQGSGFYVGYLLYSLAILAGGLFLTWIPTMKNNKWGFKMIDGRLKWSKDETVADVRRTRLVWLPLFTIFFELYGLFDYCFDLWQKPWTEMLKFLFIALALASLFVWCGIIIAEDLRKSKKNNTDL